MKKVLIKVIRKANYTDLQSLYENPILHACELKENQEFISINGEKPEGLCSEAWKSLEPFVRDLANGINNFFDGWMKDPKTAFINCNDGFRPVSFLISTIE